MPFFFKQWGANNEWGLRVGKKVAGRILDGCTWDQTPQRPLYGNLMIVPGGSPIPLFRVDFNTSSSLSFSMGSRTCRL